MAPRDQHIPVLPSLLDRLTDDAPSNHKEGTEQTRAMWRRYQDAVRRDLSWLLNTSNLESDTDLDGMPEVTRSVLNFGLSAISGRTLRERDATMIRDRLRQSILFFEPRLNPDTLKVTLLGDIQAMTHNSMVFEIEGELWARPVPIQLLLRTEVDVEVGEVKVQPASAR